MVGRGRRQSTANKDFDGRRCNFLPQRVTIFIVTFGRVTKRW